MVKALQEKFDKLDVLFNMGVANNPLLYIEKQHLINRKKFIFKYFTINETARDQKLDEINKVLESDTMLTNMETTSAKLKAIDEGTKTKEIIKFGSAEGFIIGDELIVSVKTQLHKKEFRFKQEDFLDSLLKFIQNEIKEEAKELSMKEQS